jgi:tetratricopeptide (TPR) repeat protein
MDIRTIRKLTLLLIIVAGISACQQLVVRTGPVPGFDTPWEVKPEPTPAPEPVVVQPEQQTEPEVPLPPDRLLPSLRVRKALQMLEQGDYENARNQLNWALQEKPGLQFADNLIQQIEADPIDYLGMKNFYYQVESGDSLSTIAGKFLEDPMKFVVLARYNKLENPSKLAPGDRIRVPGAMPADLWHKPKNKKKSRRSNTPTSPSRADRSKDASADQGVMRNREERDETTGTTRKVVDEQSDGTFLQQAMTSESPPQPSIPPTPTLEQVLDTAKHLHAIGELPGAIAQLESDGARYTHIKALQSLQIEYYSEYADLLILRNDLDQARNVLEKVVLLDASNEQAIKNLIKVEDKLEAKKLYRLGSDLLSAGEVEDAYQKFTQSLTYNPENIQVKQAQLACRDKLTDGYHRRAMRLFRQQELDEAIILWDKILLLDPDHPLAPGYRARAMEMQQKLEKI